jgi:hypothetical protein
LRSSRASVSRYSTLSVSLCIYIYNISCSSFLLLCYFSSASASFFFFFFVSFFISLLSALRRVCYRADALAGDSEPRLAAICGGVRDRGRADDVPGDAAVQGLLADHERLQAARSLRHPPAALPPAQRRAHLLGPHSPLSLSPSLYLSLSTHCSTTARGLTLCRSLRCWRC